ncbi:MAG: hypothetical protein U0R50_05405 [Gaiellales bacterium]
MRDRLPLLLSATALVVAVFGSTPLGNAAYQALAPGSVGTPQLKRGSVTTPKLAAGSVTQGKLAGDAVGSAQVRDGSLLATDFAAGQLPAGAKGDKGDKGDRGEKGDKVTTLVAEIKADGSITRADGVTAVTHPGTGFYQVVFDKDVSKCTPVATEIDVANAWATVTHDFANANAIRVFTYSTVGSFSGAFALLVVC